VTRSLRESGRILYISSVDVSLGNGPAVNELEFIVALHGAIGERAHFLIPRPQRSVADLPTPACTFVRPHHGHQPIPSLIHMVDQIGAASRLISAGRFDLLVFRLDVAPLVPLAITSRHRVPYALKTLGATSLNVLERLPVIGRPLAAANRRLVRGLVQRAIAADAASVSHVEALRDALDAGRDTITWIDNSVNTRRFFPTPTLGARREVGLDRFDPIAGYVGNVPHERGGRQLVEVAPRLLKLYPRLGILVLGDGEGVPGLARRADELDVAEHCVFTGHVPFERVPAYVNALDVGVSFLLPRSQVASEQKVRQYVACGKPVIATTPGGNDFVVREGLGSLVRYDDLDAIAAELDRWLSLGERAAFASRAVRYACEHLSVDQAVRQRLALWGERLERQPDRQKSHG
jgi:glycosyltransferase involved in cell wall biosynthesis